MKLNDFQKKLLSAGYITTPESTSEMFVFMSPSTNAQHLVVTVEEEFDFASTHRDISFVYQDLVNIYNTNQILFVIFTSNTQQAAGLTYNHYFCWLYNTNENFIEVHETQPYEFYNVRRLLSEPVVESAPVRTAPTKVRRIHYVFNFTNLFILVNVIVHIIMSTLGDTSDIQFMLDHGGLYSDYILDGEVYRFFTSMFMHADWIHLLGNMFVLFLVGRNLENMVGKVKFPIIYMVSGLGAGLIAEICYMIMRNNVVCVGASGAIYGLVGALLWVLIINKNRRREMTLWQVIVGIALSLGQGVADDDVSVEAHIGGLICGFLLALILYRKKHVAQD